VLRNGVLYGHIIARHEGQLWAYMMPIADVFNHIATQYGTAVGVDARIRLPPKDISDWTTKMRYASEVEYEQYEQSFYVAENLPLEEKYTSQWEESAREIISGRLLMLDHKLKKASVMGLLFIMAGTERKESAMEPTVIVSCHPDDQKLVEHELRAVTRDFALKVAFKVLVDSSIKRI
jgi:hypothetical protein